MKEPKKTNNKNGNLREKAGVILTMLGLFIFLLGAEPSFFGLDRSVVVGYIQIAVFLFGLAVMCLGGYVGLDSVWIGRRKTISADIGLRFVATGYVLSLVSGMADVFGLGTRPLPGVPFFGYWQARGVLLGEIVIAIGFLMMIPYSRLWKRGKKKDGKEL
ncbi:MAG: hypothetical protein FVQ83_16135 [Chloroflexi bacterium]|nr:hypothetical protein [Chloroflexota bacterium]